MKKLRLLAGVIAVLMSLSLSAPVCTASSFSDIGMHWARQQIEQAAREGWVSGYGDGSFRPDNVVTRAEFIKLAVASFGLQPDRRVPVPFENAKGHWLAEQGWLGVASEEGLLDAPLYKTTGVLELDAPIPRWEATVIAVRLASKDVSPSENTLEFADAREIPVEARTFVEAAVRLGIISGFTDNTYRANDSLTRAQAVVIMLRTKSLISGLTVHFLDVGQADSILIQTHSGTNVLIDGGNNADGEAVVSYLKAQGVRHLNAVIATHPHEDHIGGLDTVLNEFPVDQVYMPNAVTTTRTYEDFLLAVKSSKATVIQARAGVKLDVPGLEAVFLAPNGDYYEDLNDYSAVLKVRFGSVSFLFAGDAESVSEAEMLKAGYDLRANVLKVGHHGSDSSTSSLFLARVAPKYAVISVGAHNDFGHPSEAVLGRLSDAGVKVYRTDRDGTIVMKSNGKYIGVSFAPRVVGYTDSPASEVTPVKTGRVVIVSVGLAAEVVTLRNEDTVPVDLSGWMLLSTVGNQRYFFPKGTVLYPGETVQVASGPNARSGQGKLVWTTQYIWNNTGDHAELYDSAGRKVSEK